MKLKGWIFLYFIVLSGLFLRLYKFADSLNLGTDQTAAYILADRIINYGHVLLVGPFTSVWQLNLLPPTYYYIITVLFSLSRNELFIPLAFTFLNTVSIILICLLGKELFKTKTGLVSALLFAFSEQMVWYGRDFWEPHLVPFFIILSFLFLSKAEKSARILYMHLSAFFFFMSFLYVSSVLVLPVYFLWFLKTYAKINNRTGWAFIRSVILFLFYALIVYLPVLIFEFNNGFPSLSAITQIRAISGTFSGMIESTLNHINLFFNSMLIYSTPSFSLIVFFLFIAFSVSAFFNYSRNSGNGRFLFASFVFGLVITGLYSESPEVYRLSSLYPSFFVLVGWIITIGFAKKRKPPVFTVIPVLIILIPVIYINVKSMVTNVREIAMQKYNHPYNMANSILKAAQKDSFTLFVIVPYESQNHHGTSYWYALEKLTGKKLVSLNDRGNWIDQGLDESKSEIFLICRDFMTFSAADVGCRKVFRERFDLPDPVEAKKVDWVYWYRFVVQRSSPKGKAVAGIM